LLHRSLSSTAEVVLVGRLVQLKILWKKGERSEDREEKREK
jgi:hypothetical protein